MVFLAVCRAIFDYDPQNENELEIKEGDLLYIVDKKNEEGEEDEWWKAKKKADDEEEEEPEGLIPFNYVEEIQPVSSAKALYEYDRQTEEELSFGEDAQLDVYDTSDPDWTLVGHNGEYGFVPANYIEVGSTGGPAAPAAVAARPVPSLPQQEPEEDDDEPPPQPPRPVSVEVAAPTPASPTGPAASIANIMGGRAPPPAMPLRPEESSPPLPTRHVQFTPEPEEIPPSMPVRPTRHSPPAASPRSPSPPRVMESPPRRSNSVRSPQIRENTFDSMDISERGSQSQGGYHLYNISEMVSVMGKQKKMPVTLGINLGTGKIFLSPEKKRDGPQQEWTADKLEHYSIEGKHVFLELKKPSKSLDLHAGAKDTATEIVASLGELAGAVRGGGGFNEIVQAASRSSGPKNGQMLYDFVAQGDDEVDVAEGDEVIVLNDENEEWWKVRRVKNGKEGVVPSSYVEITRVPEPPPKDNRRSSAGAGRSTVEQNRQEDERAARESLKRDEEHRRSTAEVGPAMRLPKRSSSLLGLQDPNSMSSQRSKRDSASGGKDSKPKPKPDMKKIRTWTDRSGSFKVEAQFIGLRDGKIHLHKLNGVKIAVAVDRMSTEDLNFVEAVTGVSLDEDKPLSDLKREGSRRDPKKDRNKSQSGATVQPRSEYDWFDFFLACGVNPQLCERYSQAFSRDSMDESIQEDITPELLRTLGLKEGDIIKVMKYLDNKYNRKSKAKGVNFEEGTNGESGGIFAGPGGVLKNNTGKGRPAPPGKTNNEVDENALNPSAKKSGDRAPTPPRKDAPGGGFDDNAWEVKPSKTEPTKPTEKTTSPPPAATAVVSPPKPPPTGLNPDLAGLSLLDDPLQPVVTHSDGSKPSSAPTPSFAPPQAQQPAPVQQPQPTGASPAFFNQLPPQQTGIGQQVGAQNVTPVQPLQPQPTALQQPLGLGGARQRPQPPSQPQFNQQGQLIPPAPARPESAPNQLSPQTAFGPPAPLQPQLTGAPNVIFNPAANPSQSLADMQRMQIQQQMTAQPIQTQPTGYQQNQFVQQPLQPQMTAVPGYIQTQPTGSPFGDANRVNSPPQMTSFQPPMQPQATGINGGMIPALQPQNTGINGFGVYGQQQAPPPVPQIPQQFQQAGQSAPFQPQSQFGQQQQGGQGGLQAPAQPLVPQKTGPAPPVSFGMTAAKKLTAQPTGRANLSKATPQNPFGFD